MIFQLPNIPVGKSSFCKGFTCSVAHSCQTTPTVPVTIQLWMNHYYLHFCNIQGQNEQKFLIRWRSWSLVFGISLPTKLCCLCGNRTNMFPSRPLQDCKITLQQLLQVSAKLVSRCQSLDPELITKFPQAVYNYPLVILIFFCPLYNDKHCCSENLALAPNNFTMSQNCQHWHLYLKWKFSQAKNRNSHENPCHFQPC